MNPGKCETKTLFYNDVKLFKRYCEFISPKGRCVDIGPENAKMEYIKKHFDIEVVQMDSEDFNWRHIYSDNYGHTFQTVFCFEILEHLQNPLFFMREVKSLIRPSGGTLYLSTPGRIQWLWTDKHFIEMSPKRLQKWILEPLGLRIVRKQRLRITPSLRHFGIRPIIRLFTNNTWIYEIKVN